MRKIEEKVEAAWQRSRGEDVYNPYYPVKASSNFADGYKAGAAEALSHQWVSVEEELPEDDEDVLALAITSKNQKVGLALCFKDSNGTVKWVSDDINTDYIRFWMPIPPLPEARKESM